MTGQPLVVTSEARMLIDALRHRGAPEVLRVVLSKEVSAEGVDCSFRTIGVRTGLWASSNGAQIKASELIARMVVVGLATPVAVRLQSRGAMKPPKLYGGAHPTPAAHNVDAAVDQVMTAFSGAPEALATIGLANLGGKSTFCRALFGALTDEGRVGLLGADDRVAGPLHLLLQRMTETVPNSARRIELSTTMHDLRTPKGYAGVLKTLPVVEPVEVTQSGPVARSAPRLMTLPDPSLARWLVYYRRVATDMEQPPRRPTSNAVARELAHQRTPVIRKRTLER